MTPDLKNKTNNEMSKCWGAIKNNLGKLAINMKSNPLILYPRWYGRMTSSKSKEEAPSGTVGHFCQVSFFSHTTWINSFAIYDVQPLHTWVRIYTIELKVVGYTSSRMSQSWTGVKILTLNDLMRSLTHYCAFCVIHEACRQKITIETMHMNISEAFSP